MECLTSANWSSYTELYKPIIQSVDTSPGVGYYLADFVFDFGYGGGNIEIWVSDACNGAYSLISNQQEDWYSSNSVLFVFGGDTAYFKARHVGSNFDSPFSDCYGVVLT